MCPIPNGVKNLILALLILFVLVPFARAEEELLDRVVAVVNDEIITQAELDAVLRPVYEDYKLQYSGEELAELVREARTKILGQLIEDKLVYQEAVAQDIVINEDEIEKELSDFRKRMENPDEFDAMLEREGMNMKSLREKFKRQLMIRRLQDMEIRSRVVISPAEIEKFYRDNPDKFRKTARVKVRSLTVKKSPEAREKGIADEKAKERMDSLFLKLKQGENFEALVASSSEDSRAKEKEPSQWFEKGSMIESVDEAIFKTPKGHLTGIVETPVGFHIFKVEDVEEARQISFQEARDQISGSLFQVKSNERFREWTEQLKKTAYISIR